MFIDHFNFYTQSYIVQLTSLKTAVTKTESQSYRGQTLAAQRE